MYHKSIMGCASYLAQPIILDIAFYKINLTYLFHYIIIKTKYVKIKILTSEITKYYLLNNNLSQKIAQRSKNNYK